MKLPRLGLLAALVLSAGAISSPANIIINLTGRVTSVGADLGTTVAVGDSVAVHFAYDASQSDTNPSPDYGNYSASSFDLSIASVLTLSTANAVLVLQNDQLNGAATNPADGLTVAGYSPTITGDTLNGYSATAFQTGLRRENSLGQIWSNDGLPTFAHWANITLADLNGADWHWIDFSTHGATIFDGQIRYEITGYEAHDTSTVPDASTTWASLLIGLGGVALVRRHCTR
ncbi:MAG TPA: hypothetical protein VG734_24295 [Lacunisphaera sp.]|nr:hypothetical protein [Lacunisphaera sp.]